jgi:hypothetical protein
MTETPYDDDVTELAREQGLSLNKARDKFIWIALQMGNIGPLVCFLLVGYVPGLALRHHLAMMLATEQDLPQVAKRELRFRLEIKPRSVKRGPRQSSFEIALRNRKHAQRVAALIAKLGPGSYLSAIKTVAGKTGLSEKTIRNAYDHHRRQGKRSIN